MSRLALERVTKRFGDRVVLDEASFDVADGELVAMLGPSGSGKTTLLRTIAGLERADAGRIVLGERDITRASPRARNIGLVFQDFALFPHLSVRANIGFGVRDNRRARVGDLAERLGIADLLERYPARLSGGERQRVALARALAVAPAALLFDEPFASLDAPLRAALRIEIADLRAQASMPAIFVTHDQDEALALGDRVAVIHDGHIVALDTPAALLSAPPTAFTARFLGRPPANVFDGSVAAGRFSVTGLPAISCGGVAAGIRSIAVRPERIRIDPASALTGRVRFVEVIGTQRYATVALAGHTVVTQAEPGVRSGATVGLAFDFEQRWTYDAQGRYVG